MLVWCWSTKHSYEHTELAKVRAKVADLAKAVAGTIPDRETEAMLLNMMNVSFNDELDRIVRIAKPLQRT